MAIISLALERQKRKAQKPRPTISQLMTQNNDIMARMKAKGFVVEVDSVDWGDDQDDE